MNNLFLEYKSLRIYFLIAAISSLLIGSTVFIGWAIHSGEVVPFDPTAPPMFPNTAILFLLSSFTLFALLYFSRWLAIVGSISVLLLSGITVVEYLFNVDFGIDRLLFDVRVAATSIFPGRPAPNTVTCFFLIGLSLFASCFPYKKNISILITLLCGISVTIAIIALFGYTLGYYSIIGWYSFTGMALSTSIGIVILSTCLFLVHSFKTMYKDKSFYGSLVGGIFIIIYLTFTLWEGFNTSQHLALQKLTQNSADFIALSIKNNLNNTANAIKRIVWRWEAIGGYTQSLWDEDSNNYLEDFTGLINLIYYDKNRKIVFSRIKDENAYSPSLPLMMKVMLEEPKDEISRSLSGNFLSLIFPVFIEKGEIEGFIVGVIDMRDVVDNSIPKFFEDRFQIDVLDENRTYVENSLLNTSDWAIATVESTYIDWIVKIYPKENAFTTNYLPHLILMTGAVFAAFMIWIVSLLQNLFRAKERILRLMKEKTHSFAYRQAIINSSNYSIISTDPNGLIILYNRAAEKMLQWTNSEVVNKKTPVIFHDPKEVEERAQQLTEILGEKIEPGFEVFVAMAKRNQTDEHEWTYIRKDGTRFPVQLSVTAVRDRGKIIGYVGIAYDLTQLKEVERLKKELIAITTHEIRSPLTSIKGALDLISVAETIHPKDNELFKIAHHNCDRILHLTNDILDLQKIESGKMKLFPKDVLVKTLFDKVIEINQVFAASRNVKLVKPTHVPVCTIYVDEDRILQVLTNFISNAIKNSPKESEISFEATIHGDHVRIGVRDHGPGIPKEYQGLLFQKFSQIPSQNKVKEGTGLGLTICKSIIKEHGGQIGFDTSSEGSVFWFELPIKSIEKTLQTPEIMEKKQ